jgi:hypothetical protein
VFVEEAELAAAVTWPAPGEVVRTICRGRMA